ncbi:MAG: hypothetical protein EZS28_048074, partial [Streblomastix strix]
YELLSNYFVKGQLVSLAKNKTMKKQLNSLDIESMKKHQRYGIQNQIEKFCLITKEQSGSLYRNVNIVN